MAHFFFTQNSLSFFFFFNNDVALYYTVSCNVMYASFQHRYRRGRDWFKERISVASFQLLGQVLEHSGEFFTQTDTVNYPCMFYLYSS